MSNALVPLADTMQLGSVLAKSGFFADSRDEAQAVVKVLAGRELGFGPVASMTGINIIKGKVALSANLIAAAIKRSGHYTFKPLKGHPLPEECSIEFFERNGSKWDSLGVSTFTKADATSAGLSGGNWTKYPRNMLFARAISNGAKWYCPDIFAGPVYTPDELGAEVDGESGEVVDGQSWPAPQDPAFQAGEDKEPEQEPEQEPKPANGNGHPDRPWTSEHLKAYMTDLAEKMTGEPTEKQERYARSSLASVVNNDDGKRHSVTAFLFEKESTKDLTAGECSALIRWIGATHDNEYTPSGFAIDEAERVVKARMVELGQTEMGI